MESNSGVDGEQHQAKWSGEQQRSPQLMLLLYFVRQETSLGNASVSSYTRMRNNELWHRCQQTEHKIVRFGTAVNKQSTKYSELRHSCQQANRNDYIYIEAQYVNMRHNMQLLCIRLFNTFGTTLAVQNSHTHILMDLAIFDVLSCGT